MTNSIISDKRLRRNSIPFQGMWYSDNTGGVASNLADGNADGDLGSVLEGIGNGQVRIATPAKAQLIEARLTFNALALDGGLFRVYIGRFDVDGITPRTMTDTERATSWRKMTGFNDYLTIGFFDNIFLDGLNLHRDIPKKGEPDFNEDGFIIGIELFGDTSDPDDFILYDFKVDGTVQLAEVQK